MNWNPPLDLDKSGKVIQKVSFDADGTTGISKIACTYDRKDNGFASGFVPQGSSNKMEKSVGVTLDGILLMP